MGPPKCWNAEPLKVIAFVVIGRASVGRSWSLCTLEALKVVAFVDVDWASVGRASVDLSLSRS